MLTTIITNAIESGVELDNQFASPEHAQACVSSMQERLFSALDHLNLAHEMLENADMEDGDAIIAVDRAIESVCGRLDAYDNISNSLVNTIMGVGRAN